MDASRQLSIPERSDTNPRVAPFSQVATRPAPALSRRGNPNRTFAQVAAQVSTGSPRDINASASKPTKVEKPEKSFSLWENSKIGFGDLVDIINPLQHIPIIATIYRNRTGDTLGFASRVIGGALWGRIGGFVTGAINGVVDWMTGKDIGDHIYAAFFGKSGGAQRNTTFAKSDRLPSDSSMISSPTSLAKFEAAQAMESAFGEFDDDGGFSGRALKVAQPEAPRSPSFATPASLAAWNSYEQSIELDESEEPFRFRFPA
jgi:hypothetical protein